MQMSMLNILVNAIKGEKLNEAAEIETYYYLKDGKVQKS